MGAIDAVYAGWMIRLTRFTCPTRLTRPRRGDASATLS
jgi:hypothetical protein